MQLEEVAEAAPAEAAEEAIQEVAAIQVLNVDLKSAAYKYKGLLVTEELSGEEALFVNSDAPRPWPSQEALRNLLDEFLAENS